jgi:meso-butanediol dehydrogenase/(S,S)-butanediol dehydrogenase/diacetyl reductase
MASIWGHVGRSHTAAYSASKGAILALTRTMAVECAAAGIRVNSISPGTIATERLAQRPGGLDVLAREMVPRHPIGRLGTPEEVAEMVLFLASDRSRFMTGADLRVDGGYCAV